MPALPGAQRPRATLPESFVPAILSRMLPREAGTCAAARVPQNMEARSPTGRACSQAEPQLVSTDDDLHQDGRCG